ncbi:MAG: CopG family transcriptional regulator [Thermococci archaeon]|nr:CopG family transcriptional regulator [Thermococci archaeon]
MSDDKSIPKLFSGSIENLKKPRTTDGKADKGREKLKKEKKQKTLYVSLDMNRKLIELYGEEGRRQSVIVEDAVNLYYYMKRALGERKFEELLSFVKREDPEILRKYITTLEGV